MRRGESGAILVITLFVLVLASIIVIGFVHHASMDRRAAGHFYHAAQAACAARSALVAGESLVRTLVTRYPDSVSAWQTVAPPDGLRTEGSVLHFRTRSDTDAVVLDALPEPAAPADFGTPRRPLKHLAWPLMSGAIGVEATGLNHAFRPALGEQNSVDVNARGAIGSVPGETPRAMRAGWMYPDVDHAGGTTAPGRPAVRFAFWIEDECFRTNLQTGSDSMGRGTSEGLAPAEIPLMGTLGQIGIDSVFMRDLVDLRTSLDRRFPSLRSTGLTRGAPSDFAARAGFLATVKSAAYDVARAGFPRVNVNALYQSNDPPRVQMDRCIQTIDSAWPRFGQRFYRDVPSAAGRYANTINRVAVPPDDERIYLQKIAANLRDMIDADSQPTIVERAPGFPVRPEGRPTEALEPRGGGTVGDNPAAAIGQENVPRLQESALVGRVLTMEPCGFSGSTASRGSAAFEITLDHYLEFWNPTMRDIVLEDDDPRTDDLGRDAFLTLYNQPSISSPGSSGAVTPPIPEGRDFTIAFSDLRNSSGTPFRIPAGEWAVITTDPAPNMRLLAPGAPVFVARVPESVRTYRGRTTDFSEANTTGWPVNHTHTFRVTLDPRSDTRNDYETCVFLGNDRGLLESFCALPVVRGSGFGLSLHAGNPAMVGGSDVFVRGGSLRGNGASAAGMPSSATGDPRSLNEGARFALHLPGNEADATRFYWNNLDDGAVPASSSLGTANENFVRADRWPDLSALGGDALRAPAVILNGPLRSIGELGHVYDPARIRGSAPDITLSRGGGRTLRIGRPERWEAGSNLSGLWDGDEQSASRTWAAWVLTDVFTTGGPFRVEGLINPNGVSRDGGAALRAALHGFRFRSVSQGGGTMEGTRLSPADVDAIVAAVVRQITRSAALPDATSEDDRIFWERGEFSEIDLQRGGTWIVPGYATAEDRSREELIRRILQLLTTRGAVFTVHAVGETFYRLADGSERVLASARRRRTFELVPVYAKSSSDAFDPNDPEAVRQRFEPPAGYRVETLWGASE